MRLCRTRLLRAASLEGSAQIALSQDDAGNAKKKAADAKDDHSDIPERTMVIKKRKVETMQAVIKPSFQPAPIRVACLNHCGIRIDVQPGSVWVCEADPYYWKGLSIMAIVVIRVIAG